MSLSPPEPIISGVPYPVTACAEERPGSLDQFVGDTCFTIQMRGVHVVYGYGAFDGKSVRFYEKDHGGSGKDVRVWRITGPSGGPDDNAAFHACHEAVWVTPTRA